MRGSCPCEKVGVLPSANNTAGLELQFSISGAPTTATGVVQGSSDASGGIRMAQLQVMSNGRSIQVDSLRGGVGGAGSAAADGVIDVDVVVDDERTR